MLFRSKISPGEPSNMFFLLAFEVIHLPQSACSKDDALQNILSMLITLDTSHLEISTLNDVAESNMYSMVVLNKKGETKALKKAVSNDREQRVRPDSTQKGDGSSLNLNLSQDKKDFAKE